MSSVESVRQKAISKLTRKYGKAYVRFIMNPRHSTNALIPQPVQVLTQRIQEADSVAELQGYEEAAEGILSGRIQPTELRNVLRNEAIVGGGGYRRTARTSVSSDAGRTDDPRGEVDAGIDRLERLLKEKDAEIERLKKENMRVTKIATDWSKESSKKGLKSDLARDENNRLQMEIARLKSENAAMQQERAAMRAGDADAEMSRLLKENAKLKAKNAELEEKNSGLEVEIIKWFEAHENLKRENKKLQEQNAALERENKRLDTNNKSLRALNEKLYKERDEAKSDLERLKMFLEGAAKEVDQAEETQTAKESACQEALKRCQTLLTKCENTREDMAKRIKKGDSEINNLRKSLNASEKAKKRLSAESEALREKLNEYAINDEGFDDGSSGDAFTENFDDPKQVTTEDRLNNAAEGKTQDKDGLNVSTPSAGSTVSTSSISSDVQKDLKEAAEAYVFKDGDAVTGENVKQVKDLKISVKKGNKIYKKIVGTGKRGRKPTVKVVDKDGNESEINRAGVKIHIPQNRFEAFEGIDGLVPALPSIRIPERHEMM